MNNRVMTENMLSYRLVKKIKGNNLNSDGTWI